MGKNSGISWTDHTFNPWIGCTKVSEGCKFCYAEARDKRFDNGIHWGPNAPRKVTSVHNHNEPRRWDREAKKLNIRYRVFCASLADVFDLEAPEGEREKLWPLIKETDSLDWLLLTKRPENWKMMLPKDWGVGYNNVWLGMTTEDQETFDKRLPYLQEVKAKIKWLSVEPQIGYIEFMGGLVNTRGIADRSFDWVVFGGESGNVNEVRSFDPEWMRPLIACRESFYTKVFVKQMGSIYAKTHGYKDEKGKDPEEWEEWMRIQEFPNEA